MSGLRLYEPNGELTSLLGRVDGGFGVGQVPRDKQPDATTTTVCGFCSTGCGLRIHLRNGEAVGLTPATEYPVNLGMACPKGWESLAVLDSDGRATSPLIKDADGIQRPVSWDIAMRTMTERFRAAQTIHGAESVAFLSTGQITCEDMAALGVLAKFSMGMVHGDGNTRQCMATSVAAYKESFGFDAPPYAYEDFEESDLIVLVGSNLCIAHPILWERVLRNRRNARVIVIDPRRTETAAAADEHIALKPKGDLALFYAIAHELIRNDWLDHDFLAQHTTDFVGFSRLVERYAPASVEERTGLSADIIEGLARTIHDAERASFWWTMGVNQSHEGTRAAQAIINIALLTGNIGRPGTGANSITGQCNAMGSRLFSNTTNLIGGHAFDSAAHRNKVASILEIDEARIQQKPGLAYDEILNGVRAGKIRALWIIATNTAHSWIGRGDVRDVLAKLDFLVVQDMYRTTETAEVADLVLPAAGWGEKEGTFISSDRRITVTKKVKRAPGQALSDFSIFKLAAAYWGDGALPAHWATPEDVFTDLKRLSAGQPCDITGIEGYRMLDERGGIQWPYPTDCDDEATERRLFADGRFYHRDGRAKFCYEDVRDAPDATNERFPLVFLTGRGSAAQWHTLTRTGKSAILRKLAPREPLLTMHPSDARLRGLRERDEVEIASRHGRTRVRLSLSASVGIGQVFLPMHWTQANEVTVPVFDPYSRQPSYKATAVQVKQARKARKAAKP